ncbi:uncharacterized protein V1510DRAFT_417557 [Dipodascopsis tothii]|uniref:uncharacterized protein n=1 Tax=Dipodascopsis tothii TaxID=44089 RepID=UPI0034CE152E
MFAATPSGFQNAPVSQLAIAFSAGASTVVAIFGIKHYFVLQLVPHVWGWGQWWRLLLWQTVFLNESEVLFGALVFYNLRVIERLVGSRKFASLLILACVYTGVAVPLLCAVLRVVTPLRANYVPPGPTAVLFALLAAYHDYVPSVYKFHLRSVFAPPVTDDDDAGSANSTAGGSTVVIADKIFVYVLAAHLALSQFPANLMPALVGWSLGLLWTHGMLPGRAWRVPALWEAAGVRLLGPRPLSPTTPAARATPVADQDEPPAAPPARRALSAQFLDTFRANF